MGLVAQIRCAGDDLLSVIFDEVYFLLGFLITLSKSRSPPESLHLIDVMSALLMAFNSCAVYDLPLLNK
jgi:hypothetical protein